MASKWNPVSCPALQLVRSEICKSGYDVVYGGDSPRELVIFRDGVMSNCRRVRVFEFPVEYIAKNAKSSRELSEILHCTKQWFINSQAAGNLVDVVFGMNDAVRYAGLFDIRQPSSAPAELLQFRSSHRNSKRHGKSHQKKKPLKSQIHSLRTMPYGEYLRTGHWKGMRAQAFSAAKNSCEICGSKEALQVHHLTYKRRGCEKLRDLQVLCRGCHENAHEGEIPGVFDPMTREFMNLVRSF